ncbi:Mitochondrial inner membrane protease subunit 2-like protein [Elsinoe fawcettii]|nr:Mitochondrial inner membrane protease subunit 2-like protein [Elsinoe fawcettii]
MPIPRIKPHLSHLRPYARLLTLPLWSAAIASFLNDHFAEILSVSGRSMSPTLSPQYHETGKKDYLLLRKHNVTADLKRGDVVAFWAPHKREFLVVKRIIGLEGDLVWLDKRRFDLRGGTGDGEVEELEHQGMMRLGAQWRNDPLDLHMGLGVPKGAVRVPPGHVW